jgi:hypothetical protein
MTIPPTVSIPAEVMARQLGDETVILDLASGNYFGLDAVGARVWQLITDGCAPAAVCETLLVEYDVEPRQLESDVDRLLHQLLEKGLIRLG